MSASEQDQPTPNDPLYYAPRRVRERPEAALNPASPEQSSTSVYHPLPRSLDPEVMQEVSALAHDHVDRRKALFGAAAIGITGGGAGTLRYQGSSLGSIDARLGRAVESASLMFSQRSPVACCTVPI